MNFKKTVLSVAGAFAIVGSMIMPAFAQEEAGSSSSGTMSGATNEIGTLTGPVFSGGDQIVFSAVDVSFNTGGTVTVDKGIAVNDEQADSDGWTLFLQASPLTGVNDKDAFIEVSQLTMRQHNGTGLSGKNCTEASRPDSVPNPSNAYQTFTTNGWNVKMPLNESTQYMSVSDGRGCGLKTALPRIELVVLPGQNVDQYTGTLTATLIPNEPTEVVVAPE